MNIPLKIHIEKKLEKYLDYTVECNWERVGGGSINEAYKLTAENRVFFVKTNTTSNFSNGFKEEVWGLEFLAAKDCITPGIIDEGNLNQETYLILEWVESAFKSSGFWSNFAIDLAKLHRHSKNYFGLDYSNFMGRLKQENKPHLNFADFFIENRLIPQVRMAVNNQLLDKASAIQFEKLYPHLDSIFPREKPSAVHGDLWSGNFLCNSNEKVVFIDPAVYYGHREVDMAMTLLFGGFSEEFYAMYHEQFPMEQGFLKRKDIYNLYPLLIHLNLFGRSYMASIKAIIADF
jgi:fructosamine-3-kinase